MRRREFLKYGAGMAVLAGAVGPTVLLPSRARAASLSFTLVIREVEVELIDGNHVFALAFAGQSTSASVPGPVLRVTEGDLVTITVQNDTPTPHAFAITGVPDASTANIAPGARATARFTAPVGGTYMYLDPANAPVNRVLGLHGVLVVVPRIGITATTGSPTPYSQATHTLGIQQMFDALGGPFFPGDRWNPADPEREKIWLFHQIDPRFNELAQRRQPISATDLFERFLPRYFTINGLSGFEAGEDKSIVARGFIGQPTLIRTLNAGLVTHSPHIHGNDIHELSGVAADGRVVVGDNIIHRDTWALPPLSRKDVLLPFYRPESIPDAAFPPREEPFPMRFVMHCHTEMSQTAGGGNYPQGAVTHWELLGTRRLV